MVHDLTGGKVARQLILFSLPLLASNTLQALYNLVDMVVVGQVVGGVGMSAVSIGGDTIHILTFLAMGFSMAGQVIIAQYVGAGRMDDVRKLIGTLFTFLLIASLVLTVVCYCLRDQILTILNTPKEAYKDTMDYLVTCIAGLLFIYGYNVVSAILRGMGDSKRPFVFVAVAAVLNILLDIWFVAGMSMGALGAALATIVAQGVSFITSVGYLYKHKEDFGFDFKARSFKIDSASIKSLISLGVPMAIQSAAVSISKIVLGAWINAEGLVYSAMNGVYAKTSTMVSVVSNSFTTAGSSMIGQSIGAQKYDRVPAILRVIWLFSLMITLILTAIMIFWHDTVFMFFTSDRMVLKEAAILVGPIIVNLFGCATRSVAFGLINGSGNAKLNLAVALIDGMISRIGIAGLLGFALGLSCKGFWYGDALAGFIPITIGTVFFISGKWRTGKYLANHLNKAKEGIGT